MLRPFTALVAVCLLAAPALTSADEIVAPQHSDYDDCDAKFISFLGSDAYQFSPQGGSGLNTVRLFSILSYQRAGVHRDFGRAVWKLEVSGPQPASRVVYVAKGEARIGDVAARTMVEHDWDGRDMSGRLVPGGKYSYVFKARFVPDRSRIKGGTYDETTARFAEAVATSEELIVNYELTEPQAVAQRASLAATTCQTKQNTPLEAGFGYNYYYGSTHAHSNFSDGGHPTSACASGNGYGSGNFAPADVYAYARHTAGMDFWLINEHNHLINDSIATNNGPVTEAKVKQRYQDGRNASAAATVDGAFVGLYGMEWGVSSNPDQGHVTLVETPKLFGWEGCTTCNGPNPECTPGTNCYFDVFTPKRYGYLTMYQRSVENPSPAGALGIFCHPASGEFDNYAFNANADNAMQGIAVRSGLAFSTGENCSDTNVGSSDYSSQWKNALNKGFHIGPVADHDSHCNNYGQGIPNRTVYLLPNGVTTPLTKLALLQAHKARHFYATEDSNAQLVFTATGGKIMGDIFTAAGAVTLRVAAYDPNGDAVSNVEIWRGQIGGGVPSAAYRTVASQASLSISESPAAGTYYYFAHVVQADGHDLWSAPMWITYGGATCTDTTAPAVSVTAPAAGSTIACTNTTVRVSASDAAGIASAQVQIDGGTWNTATWNATAGAYEYTWASSTATSATHTIAARATDASCGANVGTSASVSVTVNNTSCGGTVPDLAVGGWKITQANAALTYTIPAGTVIPGNGYLIVGREATKAAFETFWRGGAVLPSNVRYVNSAGLMPQINGSETYQLLNASSVSVDGPTIAMATAGAQSIRRNDPCQAAGTTASWAVGAESGATPGSGAGAGCGKGVVVNEFTDASGTGNYVYEFVELHYDAPSGTPTDTQPPTASITAPAVGATVSGTISVTASATDNVGVTSVEFLLDGVLQTTDSTAPYAWSWVSTGTSNGSHSVAARSRDAAGNATLSPAVSVTVSNGGTAVTAVYDATLKAPKCVTAGISCDSGASMLLGRGTLGPEPNQANTINASCADGSSGSFHVDESNDRLKVSTVDGTSLKAGKQVRIDATMWAYSTFSSDKLDLYYTANASAPTWTFLATLSPTKGGSQVLSATYTLPAGATQAVRAQVRYQGAAGTCTSGAYNDRDDLVFAVAP